MKIYKNYYMDFLYFNFTVDDFISAGKEDDGSLKDIRKNLRATMSEMSSHIKWKDTNHCRGSFSEGCEFIKLEKNFKFVFDSRTSSYFDSFDGKFHPFLFNKNLLIRSERIRLQERRNKCDRLR